MSPPFTTLVGVGELAALRAGASSDREGSAAMVIVDVSFDLAAVGAGERRFAASHVPGSHYLHLDRDLCGPKSGRNGRHPLPDRGDFARTVGQLGIGPGTQVVGVDGQGGVYAARLWWMLRWLGHAAVAVLDGGLAAWRDAGGELTDTATAPSRGARYPDRPSLVSTVDAVGLVQRRPECLVLDARSSERFRGDVEPIDPVAGHIPGARNRFHKSNLDPQGAFKAAPQLRLEFAELLGARAPADLVHSCGSGVTACHNLLAMEHAGLAGSLLYPGSWSEWSADPARPVAIGGE